MLATRDGWMRRVTTNVARDGQRRVSTLGDRVGAVSGDEPSDGVGKAVAGGLRERPGCVVGRRGGD